MHTNIHILWANQPTDLFLGGGRKPEKPEETHMNMGKAFKPSHRHCANNVLYNNTNWTVGVDKTIKVNGL